MIERVYMCVCKLEVVDARGRPSLKWVDRVLEYVKDRRFRGLEHARKECKDRNKCKLICHAYLLKGVARNRHQIDRCQQFCNMPITLHSASSLRFSMLCFQWCTDPQTLSVPCFSTGALFSRFSVCCFISACKYTKHWLLQTQEWCLRLLAASKWECLDGRDGGSEEDDC